MLMCTTWRLRPLTPEQTGRMMTAWGKMEAMLDENPDSKRIGWYINADGSGGVTLVETTNDTAQQQLGLQQALVLGEFLEIHTSQVLDLDTAMPAIMAATETITA